MKIYKSTEAENKLIEILELNDFKNSERCKGMFAHTVPAPEIGFHHIKLICWVAFDNSTGDCWVEEFATLRECLDWVKGKAEVTQ